MTGLDASPTLHALGPDAVLAEVADSAAALSLAAYARATGMPAEEVVPGACTVLFEGLFDRGPDLESLARLLSGWTADDDPDPGPLVQLEVTYDGADLRDVASRWGTDVDGVVARHTATEFVAAFCGFAPGFAYLGGLPADHAVPRLDTPRTRVPAGAVGLAGHWCGVY